MSNYFALQSNQDAAAIRRAACPDPALRLPRGRPLTSSEWVAYFRANASRDWPLPWRRSAEVTPAELACIARSLQAWQLGETSDGGHLRAAAARYAQRIGDPDYAVAVELFIREEQRHGAMLGRFLDLAGVGRRQVDWGDRLFRAARYFITDIEAWTTPVVMVETLAVVYYNAVRRATRSPLLRSICARILADEIPHLRFQCERLALLFARRSRPALALTLLGQRLCFLAVMLLVWMGHRGPLRAGGYPWHRYWRASWDRMNHGWRQMRRARPANCRRPRPSPSPIGDNGALTPIPRQLTVAAHPSP